MQLARPHRIRRAVVYAALAALLGVVSLTLSQCTQVADNLTGVGLNSTKPVSCKHQCDIIYNLAVKAENKRHETAMKLCELKPEPLRTQCKNAENLLHKANLASLAAQRDACKHKCHKQGAGTAG